MGLDVITIKRDRFRATMLLEAFRVVSMKKCETLMGYMWEEPFENRDAILALGPYLEATVKDAQKTLKKARRDYADEWKDVRFVRPHLKAYAEKRNAALTAEVRKSQRKLDRAKKLLAYWQQLENR